MVTLKKILLATIIFPFLFVQPAIAEEVIPAVPPILEKIAQCESHGHQFDLNGKVHMGKINPLDTGKFQINQHYHLKNAQKMGMDIFTLKGNTEYALYLYHKNGTRDWNWSKKCWGKKL